MKSLSGTDWGKVVIEKVFWFRYLLSSSSDKTRRKRVDWNRKLSQEMSLVKYTAGPRGDWAGAPLAQEYIHIS